MTLQRLLRKLEDECLSLHDDYKINSGGCCFLAYIIAKEFDKRDIDYSLVIGDDYRNRDYNSIYNEVISKTQNDLEDESVVGYNTMNHYFLNVEGFYLNSNNGYNIQWTIPVSDYTPIKWIWEHGEWNSWYDTANNNEIIKRIKSIFKEYDKEG